MINPVFWSPGVTLEHMEMLVILAAYKHYSFNKTATSNALKISIRTLDAKLTKYEKDKEAHEQRAEDARTQRELFNKRQRGAPNSTEIRQPPRAIVGKSGVPSEKGIRVEPSSQATAQHEMPLQKRAQV